MKTRDAKDKKQVDSEIFEQAMRDVKRLSHKQAASSRVQSPPLPTIKASSDIITEFGEELRYLRPGIQASALQKLRRGHFPIEATLDLHGLSSVEASNRLREFLQESRTLGRGAVRIVHGKGYGSVGRPVLKARVRQLLQENSNVLAFSSASQQEGGTGAVNVLLKKSRTVR
jgi:DNA-nicking Smr family endonuclease